MAEIVGSDLAESTRDSTHTTHCEDALVSGDSLGLPELGVIEGYYGEPWSWEERADTVRFLAPLGYGFYLYAPKTDPWLRERWAEDHPSEATRELRRLSAVCAAEGVRFGVGLSPLKVYLDWNDAARNALSRRLNTLDRLNIQDMALLFDDMPGAVDGLADRQVEIAAFVAERTSADRLIVCPTYYSDDPVLDQVFGERPNGYLRALGQGLDRSTHVFWTGPEVISRAISPSHIDRVAEELGRPPFLWDNYPVNDGRRMSAYLHLRGFTGRSADLAGRIAGHGVNPALQATLSRIPMATLQDVYRDGDAYEYSESFHRASRSVLGDELGDRVREDLLQLQDVGLPRLAADKERYLRDRYEGADHPGAKEIVRWLDGGYAMDEVEVPTE